MRVNYTPSELAMAKTTLYVKVFALIIIYIYLNNNHYNVNLFFIYLRLNLFYSKDARFLKSKVPLKEC